jgi:Fur family ferric uptake transcriptional regulator
VKKKRTDRVDELRTRIRASGLRVTAPRVAVLQRVLASHAPCSHAELAEALAPDGWDRATVFRNLTDLAEAGLLHRVDVGDHVWRFEACDEPHPHSGGEHPHFVCDDCGDVQCLPNAEVRVTTSSGPRALKTKAVEIQIKGRCDRCG